MTDDRFLELAPVAALGALDGEDLSGFAGHLASCGACRGEVSAHEATAARLPLALVPVPPSSSLRGRVLAATRPAPERPHLFPRLAVAAAIVLGLGLVFVRAERDAARRDAESARSAAVALEAGVREARRELAEMRSRLEREAAFRELVARPESRVARLAGLPAAPGASGRVIWDPKSREAVLIASGLAPTPEGKAYEVWVIAKGAPVPAGVFQVDAGGRAVFPLPVVDETAAVKTFAVTLEPAAGTSAPTGPMVLAGAAS